MPRGDPPMGVLEAVPWGPEGGHSVWAGIIACRVRSACAGGQRATAAPTGRFYVGRTETDAEGPVVTYDKAADRVTSEHRVGARPDRQYAARST